MDFMKIAKWVAVAFVAWLAFRWVSGYFAGSLNIGDGTIWPGAAYAPPITAPATPLYAWIPPWETYPGGRRGRGRGRR
jgi:hypothetical protein